MGYVAPELSEPIQPGTQRTFRMEPYAVHKSIQIISRGGQEPSNPVRAPLTFSPGAVQRKSARFASSRSLETAYPPFYLIPILAEDQRSSHFTPTCLMLVDMLLKGNIRSLVQQRVTLSTKSCTCSFEPSPPAKLMMAFTRCPGDEAGVYHGGEISDGPTRTRNPASCRQNHQRY